MRIKEYFAHARAKQITGTTDWRGISTISSGTSTVSVGAAAARSGSVIITSPIQWTTILSSANFAAVTAAGSVRTGGFNIFTVGSVAPPTDMPVAWFIIR